MSSRLCLDHAWYQSEFLVEHVSVSSDIQCCLSQAREGDTDISNILRWFLGVPFLYCCNFVLLESNRSIIRLLYSFSFNGSACICVIGSKRDIAVPEAIICFSR